jgi:hypothetical protein
MNKTGDYWGSTRGQSVWNANTSIKSIRAHKDAIKEETMKRIDSMGFRPPTAWKDELYRNGIQQIDLK